MSREELSRRELALCIAIPLLAALLAHFWGLRDSFVNYDTYPFLIGNPLTSDPMRGGALELLTTPELGYPIPTTVLAYAAQRAVFDLDPLPFHIVSLLLHLGVVSLVFAFARRIGASARAAAAMASIFAVHPLTVEPVTWVVGQKDLLATVFLLGALYIRLHPDGAKAKRTAISLALTVLALLSKPSAVCAPVLFVIADWVAERSLRRHLILYVTLALMAFGVTALSIYSHETHMTAGPSRNIDKFTLVSAAYAAALQFAHVFAPYRLTARYVEPSGWLYVVGALVGVLVVAAMLAVIVWSSRRGDRKTAAGLLFCGAAYGPVAGLIPISRGPADSYMYLPLALLAASIAPALGRFAKRSKRLAITLFTVSMLGLWAVSASTHHNWGTSLRLWMAVLDKYPDDPMTKLQLAQSFLTDGRVDLTLATLEQLEIDHPEYENHLWFLGDTYALLKRFQDAEKIFTRAARTRSPGELARYGNFLLRIRVEASDSDLARAALLRLRGRLLESGDVPLLERAAYLARQHGPPELAADLQKRLDELRK